MAEIDSKVLRYNYQVGRSSTRAVERSIFINLEAGAATLDFVLTPPANRVTGALALEGTDSQTSLLRSCG